MNNDVANKCKTASTVLNVLFWIFAILGFIAGFPIGDKLANIINAYNQEVVFGFVIGISNFCNWFIIKTIVCNILSALAAIVENTSKISSTSNAKEENKINNNLPQL